MILAHFNQQEFEQERVAIKKVAPTPSAFAVKMAKKKFVRTYKNNISRIRAIQEVFPDWDPKFNIHDYKFLKLT